MTAPPHMQLTGVDKLIMAAQMESSQSIPPSMSFYSREPPLIPTPRNKSELELYELLKRSNLTDYFPVFLRYGGDDVQQLAEANEEEFLEIVELIGMHQKPLHVRRLQKTLAQWRSEKLDSLTLGNERRSRFYYDSAGYFLNNTTAATTDTNTKSAANTPANQQHHHNHHHQSQRVTEASFRSDATRCSSSSVLDESIGLTSSASRSLFPVSNDDQQSSKNTPQQYCTPHQVFRNAPKRPRLMDSIKPSDLTKGIQLYDISLHSTPVRHLARNPTPDVDSNNKPDDDDDNPHQQPIAPAQKRHPIQISPPDSGESDSDDDSSSCAEDRTRARRTKAIPTKSK